MTRRSLVACAALALALTLLIAGAGSALAEPADPGRATEAAHGGAAKDGKPPEAEGSSSRDAGSSPVVPLVFAGIVLLAALGPWLPSPYRYVEYRIERPW